MIERKRERWRVSEREESMTMEKWILGLFLSIVFIGTVNAQVLRFKLQKTPNKEQCDIFRGEWISSPLAPPYSENCKFIEIPQNCLKNGRPNKEYLHWRWKPYDCDLPNFDPQVFLDVMKDKVFASVGDSLGRNQMESVMCLLSKVEEPILVYQDATFRTTTWYFTSYNFTVASIWSPFLVQPETPIVDTRSMKPIHLHLDIPDNIWVNRYHEFDYLLIGGGAWFDRPTIILENSAIVGCHKCKLDNVPQIGMCYIYRKAMELAFKFMIASAHKPLVIYRTHSPNHFEHGDWQHGGYCNKTLPYKEGEFDGSEQDQELQAIGREEFTKAIEMAEVKMEPIHLEMLDVYHLSLPRPDGHPDKYRGVEGTAHDCLHWCLPGAIDAWNDLMMATILRHEDLKHSY